MQFISDARAEYAVQSGDRDFREHLLSRVGVKDRFPTIALEGYDYRVSRVARVKAKATFL
jgi:hypothetical protein